MRDGKGFKDRVTMLLETIKDQLETHLDRLKLFFQRLQEFLGRVSRMAEMGAAAMRSLQPK